MKKRIFMAGIAFFLISLLFSSYTISADIYGNWNATTFLGLDGQLRAGYRCGTLTPTAEEMEAVERATNELRGREAADIPCIVTIPVAFHIIRHNDGVTGNVTDTQINDQIAVLNGAYASTNFQFKLQSVDRVNNTAWSTHTHGSAEETAMKNALAVSPATTLNLYTCNLGGGLLGYATFSWMYPETSKMHGVVVNYNTLPGGSGVPYHLGDTGTHEVGHYLGLWHTFQGGCTAPGDQIDDTPYEASPAYGCPAGRDTCSQAGQDPIYNFMDYSDDACMNHFTADQSVRIDEQVALGRPSLITCDGGMPEVLFDAFNNVYVVAADLGMLGADQWAILVKADLAGSPPDIGLGFAFYHPDYHDLALHIVRDDAWLSHSWEGVWAGSGSDFVLTTSALYMGMQPLWTTPPSDAKVANDDPSLP